MKTRLVVVQEARDYYRWRIQWEFLDEDERDGGYLVQMSDDGLGEPPNDREEWEHWAASRAVRETNGYMHDNTGAYWESRRLACAARDVAVLAIKQERPLPEWAKRALAEGWKPPKGWKS